MQPESSELAAAESRELPLRPARRSLWVLLLMGLGFVAARWSTSAGLPDLPSAAWFSVACVLVAIGLFARKWVCKVALGAAVVLAAGGWFTMRIAEPPRHALAAMLSTDARAEAEVVTIEGLVIERARLREAERGEFDAPVGEAKWVVEVAADTLLGEAGPVRALGRVRVFVAGGTAPYAKEGERIRITGAIDAVRSAGNPGEFDLESWARQEGVAGTLSVPGVELVEVIDSRGGLQRVRATWLAWRGWLRDRASRAMGGAQSSDQAMGRSAKPASDSPEAKRLRARALLRSLLLGERDPELREVQSAFQDLGLVHLVAISGFNLAVMAFIALFVLRLTGDRGWLEPALLATVVVLYLLVLPAQAPIVRSGLLVLALLFTEAGGRRYDRISTLGWIGCALLVWKPLDLWSLGFQLSMGVTAALLWQGHRASDRLFGAEIRGLVHDRSRAWDAKLRRAMRSAWRLTKQAAAASLLSWAVATPLVICQTGMVSPLAPLTTLLVLPLVTIVLWAGYLALMAGMIIPGAADLSRGLLDLLASFLSDAVLWLDALPGMTFHFPRVSMLWAAAATVCILWWFARGNTRHRAGWIAAALLATWLGGEVLLRPRLAVGRDSALRVDALAVDDGTCILIRAGGDGNDALLWDCGSLSPRIGERVVTRAVRGLGAWKVRTAVVTHANVDHFSGLVDVVGPLGIRVVLVSRVFAAEAAQMPTGGPARLLAALRNRGVEIRVVSAGDRFSIGNATVEFLWPTADYTPRLVNDASLVARVGVRINSGERTVLLTGDIGQEAIARLMPDISDANRGEPGGNPLLDGESVLELPHHGSVNEASIEFVRSLAPQVVLQSTGPKRARRQEWNAIRESSAWWVTALDGAAWAEIRRDGEVRSGSHAE